MFHIFSQTSQRNLTNPIVLQVTHVLRVRAYSLSCCWTLASLAGKTFAVDSVCVTARLRVGLSLWGGGKGGSSSESITPQSEAKVNHTLDSVA